MTDGINMDRRIIVVIYRKDDADALGKELLAPIIEDEEHNAGVYAVREHVDVDKLKPPPVAGFCMNMTSATAKHMCLLMLNYLGALFVSLAVHGALDHEHDEEDMEETIKQIEKWMQRGEA